jgi:hypothetical protein
MPEPHIDWSYPPPRRGWRGEIDTFFGPGTTRAEAWIIAVASLAAAIALPLYAALKGLGWSAAHYTVGTLIAADMAGGIVTNATSSAKRWYHRAGQAARRHFTFVAVHVVHIFLVAWLFRSMDWLYFTAMSGYLLATALVIVKIPLYLQRPVAMGFFAAVIPLHAYAFAPTPGLEWFIPFLFLKLLVGHLLREEPYRPARVPHAPTGSPRWP